MKTEMTKKTTTKDQIKINQICEEIMDVNGPFQDYIRTKIPQSHQNDLLQEILLILLDKPKKLIEAYEKKWLRYLFVNISSKQFFSSTSPYHKKYRQPFNELSYDMNIEDTTDIEYKTEMGLKWDLLQESIKNTKLSWYQQQLMEYYFDKDLSYKKIEKELGIDHSSVFIEIHKCLRKIRENLPENNFMKAPELGVYKTLPNKR